MKQEFEVTVEELLHTLQRRGIPLPSEMGAFITLEVCEQMIDRPIHVMAREIGINEIGEVQCGPQPTPTDEEDSVRSLLVLLGDLLVCAAPGVPPMLLELVERGPEAPELTLDRLRDELEACLLPLNRGATRRVLARLLREARKAGPSLRSRSQPTAADIDAQFDALLGTSPGTEPAVETAATTPRAPHMAASAPARSPKRFDETPVTEPHASTPAGAATTARARELDAAVAAARKRTRTPVSPSPEPRAAAKREAVPSTNSAAEQSSRPVDTESSEPMRLSLSDGVGRSPDGEPASRTSRSPDMHGLVEDDQKRSSAGIWIFAGCVLAALVLVGGYLALGRQGTREALGMLPRSEQPLPAAPVPSRPVKQVGELLVNSEPPRAQVFMLIGPGPALATDLPLGVAQEFVALAEGYAPARAIVPADASWEDVNGQPRYELAMQAPRSNVELARLGLGKTLLPQDVGTPQARLGSVRIVTTPRGAKVYQLIGFTPDVRVENLPLDQSYELLVYVEGKPVATRQLTAADFSERDGKRAAAVDITFTPAKAR